MSSFRNLSQAASSDPGLTGKITVHLSFCWPETPAHPGMNPTDLFLIYRALTKFSWRWLGKLTRATLPWKIMVLPTLLLGVPSQLFTIAGLLGTLSPSAHTIPMNQVGEMTWSQIPRYNLEIMIRPVRLALQVSAPSWRACLSSTTLKSHLLMKTVTEAHTSSFYCGAK